jgi:hypothetical protein
MLVAPESAAGLEVNTDHPQAPTTAAAEGPRYERLTIIPESTDAGSPAPAYIFIKITPPALDSNAGDTYTATGILDGERIHDDFYDYTSRTEVIADAVKALAAKAAGSRKKAWKAAAEILNQYVTGAMANFTADDWGPVAEEDGGDIWGVGQTAEETATTDTPATAGTLAGEGGEQVDEPTTAERNAEAVRVFKERMLALSQELVTRVLDRTSLEAKLKSAKALEKETIDEIQSASARGPEFMPLFDASPTHASQTSEASVTADVASDAWRKESIESLGLPPKLAEKLAENSITTIGELEDKRAAFGGLSSISGIGPAKVTVIEDAVMGWLSENRDTAVFEAARDGSGSE